MSFYSEILLNMGVLPGYCILEMAEKILLLFFPSTSIVFCRFLKPGLEQIVAILILTTFSKEIAVLMLKGAAMNAECKVVDSIKLGDHTAFIGEVVEISINDKEPIVYSNGKYWRFGEQIMKPSEEERARIDGIIEKHKK